MPALPGDLAWIPDRREQGTVEHEMASRSCEVETTSGMFRKKRLDIINLLAQDISPTRPKSDDHDLEEMTTEDRSQLVVSGGGLPSPWTHTLRRSSRVTYNPDRYDPCAW